MAKQIQNILFYSVTMFLLLMAVFFYRQSFLVMLFLLMVLLPVVSIFFSRWAFSRLSVDIAFSAIEAEKNLPVTLSILLHNPTPLPLLHVECVMGIVSPYYQEKGNTTYILPAQAKNRSSFSLPVTYCYCGLYQASVTSLKVYDYLHIFSFSKKMDKQTQVVILPTSTTGETSFHPSLYKEGFDEYEASSQKGNVSSNVTDVREYQPGDRLQKIHWKLSAKIDKLMVKENEATSSHQFYVLLELYKNEDHPEYLDHAIEYAYGISKELLAMQENFFFGFYSKIRDDFVSIPIRHEADLTEALYEAYYETPCNTENLALSMYQNSGMQKGTLLQVTYKGVSDEFFE